MKKVHRKSIKIELALFFFPYPWSLPDFISGFYGIQISFFPEKVIEWLEFFHVHWNWLINIPSKLTEIWNSPMLHKLQNKPKIGTFHNRKYGPVLLASYKVALFLEHFNRHRLKCFVHHATFHVESSLLAFSIVYFEWLWIFDSWWNLEFQRPAAFFMKQLT